MSCAVDRALNPKSALFIDRIKNFCGSIADTVLSKENVINIRYYAEPVAFESKFEILFTAYRDKGTGE